MRPHKRLLQVRLHHWHRFHTKRKLPLFSRKEVTVNYYLSLFLQSAPLSAPCEHAEPVLVSSALSAQIFMQIIWPGFWRVEAKSLAHPDKGVKIGF